MTYPPPPTNGYVISDWLTPPNEKRYTYPEGLADEIELRIDVDVRLLSNDLDSKNKIGIVFSGRPFRALIYEFDNDRRGWRSKPPGKRMTLRFIDPTEGKSGGDFKEEEKRLRLKGVFDDVEGAFVRLNTFLNQAPLV